MVATALAALLAATFAWAYFTRPAPEAHSLKLSLALPENTHFIHLALSPDGKWLAFNTKKGESWQLWALALASGETRLIVEDQGVRNPFWSPDSRFIGFYAGGKLKKVAAIGGPPQILCDVAGGGLGTWNQDDVILFSAANSIYRVAASGGPTAAIRTPDKSASAVAAPHFLPDGRHFVYIAATPGSDRAAVEARIGSLDSNDDRSLFPVFSRVLYAEPGYLLFVKDGTLMAQPFNAPNLTLNGDMFPIAEKIGYNPQNGNAAVSVSSNGTLVYRTTNIVAATELTWLDRSGKKVGTIPATGNFQRPYLSPDEKHLVVEKRDGNAGDIWLIDLARGTNSRFTFDPADETYPMFSWDGQQVAFTSNRGGKLGLYIKSASGVGNEELIQSAASSDMAVTDWSRDGKVLTYGFVVPNAGYDSWILPMTGDRKPFPILTEKFNDFRVRFSPDGKWILYTSTETGRSELYVQTFPPSGGKWQVSVAGGNYGYWRGDGKEIIFDTLAGKMMAVDVKLDKTFEAGVPHALFDIPGAIAGGRFVVSSNAQRFLLPLQPQSVERPTITTVLNWTADIKK
jgi:Tol biopolymer transport system component